MSVQRVKKLNKHGNEQNVNKNKRKDILITKKIEKLIQKRQLEVVPINFTLELMPKYQFYISGEIVVDFDIFKEESGAYKQNPTNLFKILDKMTRCKNHLEFQTVSNVPMMNNFEIIISTVERANHPKAKEMSYLLKDYQEKVSRRCKYASILQKQQEQKQIHINYAERKEKSFENAQKIIDSICRDNPNSIFFFVVRRKGLNSIDVIKSGYSNSAIKLSGYTLQEFEQSILRDRSVPIKHQNNAWDYMKEKMYSNFHNKNYNNVQRKVKLKSGQELNIFVSAKTFPLNVNLSPDPHLLDLNDYLEFILVEPFISKIDRFQEANEFVVQNQQSYREQANKFIQMFYSNNEEMKELGFTKSQTKNSSQTQKYKNEAQLMSSQDNSSQVYEQTYQNQLNQKQSNQQEDIQSNWSNNQQFNSVNQNSFKENLNTNQNFYYEDQNNQNFNQMSRVNLIQLKEQPFLQQQQYFTHNQTNEEQIQDDHSSLNTIQDRNHLNKEQTLINNGNNYSSDGLIDDKSSNLFQSSDQYFHDYYKKDHLENEDTTKYLNQEYQNSQYQYHKNCYNSEY